MQAMSETRKEMQSLTTHQGSRAMAIGGLFLKEFYEEVTCPICLNFFKDPVTIDCGHNFCQACFTQYWGKSDADCFCLQCKGTFHPTRVRPDHRLANLVELVKKVEEEKGVAGKWGGCVTHEEPLKLFCKNDQALICVVCDRSIEHRDHSVLPMEEAAQEYKIKIQTCLISLEKEKIKVKEQKVAEEEESQNCLGELEAEKLKRIAAFQQMQNFLEEKKDFWLGKLNYLEKEIQKRREENVSILSEEISRLGLLIMEMEEKCQQPTTEFLQDISIALSRYEKNQERQPVELYPGMLEMVRTCVLKTPALEKALRKCEVFLCLAVNVTLDQNTANSFLILSEDQRTVSSMGTNQGLPDNPGRFDTMQCVLGCEKFTSGRHWWEVEAEGGGTMWAVGIATELVRRKGNVTLNPNEGIWLVQRTTNGTAITFSALTAPQPTVLYNYAPSKIRVSLDYEEGRVQFFHADTNQLIFNFPSASFSGQAIRPFFLMYQGITLNLK
ncbi:zinc finger protein RFP-like isoform X2 [Heteronotia binoei]|uniref:zinc finger protein RFP-like isoform X2 n=1 Tax=Heteronotia binoei TaxID=13085 RepID=UPI00292D63F7|nr:zinc finger protein RFP-like isoform X2 [Heteronotia binoei]